MHVGEQIIETTDNHPFWVEGKGWVFADELQVGDKLQKADGSNLTIDKVELVKLDEPVTVCNITVADYHTYYVTDIWIWVHNTKCGWLGDYRNFNDMQKNMSAEDLVKHLKNSGYKKTIDPARSARSGEAILFTDDWKYNKSYAKPC